MAADNVAGSTQGSSGLGAQLHRGPHFEGCEIRPRPLAAPEFNDCLERLASAVAIAACATRSGPQGVLIHTLTGLSPQPPRVLFCVRKVEEAHFALLAADSISLSILATEQQSEAERFSQKEAERFGAAWRLAGNQPPRLLGALASVEGPVRTRIDAGSHTVFILDVTFAETRAGAPLVYFERGFLQPGRLTERARIALRGTPAHP